MKRKFKSLPVPVRVVCIAALVILGASLVFAGFGVLVVWLWNRLMPDIFGLPEIRFWQAVGLFVLAKIFFGGVSQPSVKNVYSGRSSTSPSHPSAVPCASAFPAAAVDSNPSVSPTEEP